jgi:hypothetical protein
MWLRSRLLRFIGKTIAFFIVISVLWHFVAPTYNRLLAGAADQFGPGQTAISAEQDNLYILPELNTGPAGMYEIYGLDMQYGLLLVVALIAATPGLRLTQRFRYIPIAFVIMFIIHVATILIFAYVAESGTPASVTKNPFVVLFSILGTDLFPVLVWGVLSFRYFLPKPNEEPLVPKMQLRFEREEQRA